MNKFKVGDIVKGQRNSGYHRTNEDMTKGEIIDTRSGYTDDIRVKILEHESSNSCIGAEYWVNSSKFTLVKAASCAKTEAVIPGLAVITELGKTFLVIKDKYVICVDALPKDIGVSKCCSDDTFNLEVGKALAYFRQAGDGLSK